MHMMRPSPASSTAPQEGSEDFPLKVLRILFFAGFGLLATILAFVFLPLAGLAFAAIAALRGYDPDAWRGEDFALRVLAFLGFAAFAVIATILAFVFIPLGGAVLALLFAWRAMGGGLPARFALPRGLPGSKPSPSPTPAPITEPEAAANTAFRGYREDTLRRLEAERAQFEGFLDRLRHSRDRKEFDAFLDERAARARPAPRDDAGAAP